PGRYVGAEAVKDDDEPFDDKIKKLTARLYEQFTESARLERAIQDNLRIIPLLNPNISFETLLKFLCRELGLPDEPEGHPGLLNQLLQGLSQAYKAGTNMGLLIDEAQNMSEETLESLRMVSNLEIASEKPIQIVFIGQPEFWETLGHHELRQLKQRIGVRITLPPLTPAESRDYIAFRIGKAGGQVNSIFTKGALEKIIHQAEGVPGKINILTTTVLISGCEYSQKPISGGIVKTVIHGPQRIKSRHYFPWIITAVGVLLIFLGFLAWDRFPNFLFTRENTSRLPVKNQEPTGPMVTAKVIDEQSAPPVTAINPTQDRESGRPSKLPTTGRATPGEAPAPSPIFSGLKPPPARAVRVVKEGDNFFRMVLKVYGFSNPALWDLVRKSNPGIKDITKIRIGEKIIFPEWKEGLTISPDLLPRVGQKPDHHPATGEAGLQKQLYTFL
ncbi:MAG: AAA family ATPase, partial [Pseudomonadota bacterium]